MSDLKNLPPDSITTMTIEDIHERLRLLRQSRRTPKASTKKRQAKKAETQAKQLIRPDATSFSEDVRAKLLAELEVEE